MLCSFCAATQHDSGVKCQSLVVVCLSLSLSYISKPSLRLPLSVTVPRLQSYKQHTASLVATLKHVSTHNLDCSISKAELTSLLQVLELKLGDFVELNLGAEYDTEEGQEYLGVMQITELFEDTQVVMMRCHSSSLHRLQICFQMFA